MSTLRTNFSKQISRFFPVDISHVETGSFQANYLADDIHLLITLLTSLPLFSELQIKTHKIAYICTEGTMLSPRHQLLMEPLDEIWVPSKWHAAIYDHFNVHVVHPGVDETIFNPQILPESQIKSIPEFKFLCVARFEDQRKNIPQLISTFIKTFKNEPVKLILPMTVSEEPPIAHPQLIYISPVTDSKTFAQIYTSCDAFVLPTRAEGWGLPICEAMACGLPVITTLYSAVTEYANEDLIYPINFEITDIHFGQMSPSTGLRGLWAEPDFEHLAEQMRYVYKNRDEAKEKGLRASKHILENFTWDHSGKSIQTLMSQS
jgi:glycosyltransferase involved in cell wall biosynthesis